MYEQRKHIFKYTAIILLLAISIVSWWQAASLYQNNRGEIAEAVEQITREITLPYHIAALSTQEPVTELPVPVYGVSLSQVSDTWGAARAEGRSHEGTDIFAERGTPVFSATEGYVMRLNIGTRGGKNVGIIGPGGVFYYYAHFDRLAIGIERGQEITTDTVLGFVGNSGNASGTPPHLHFGVYEETGRWNSATNPYPLLTDR